MTDKETIYKIYKLNLENCKEAPKWARELWQRVVDEWESKNSEA